jgi:5-formyltetrahydrofolate cyclo-ligase
MTEPLDSTAKAVLRLQVRNLRRAFVREHPEADWQAGDMAERMLRGLFPKGRSPGNVAIYRASGSEIDPRPLGEELRRLGWRLALPASDEADAPVVFRGWRPGDRLVPDAMGIAAPLAAAAEVRPDVIVAPLIAFDRRGGRLGQGGGYYDRTLQALRNGASAPAFVGLAFSIQEVDHVPLEPHDQRLDAILTEKEFIPVRKDF